MPFVPDQQNSQAPTPGFKPDNTDDQSNPITDIVKNYAKYMGGVVSGGVKGLTLGNYDPLPELRQGSTAAGIGGGVGNVVGGAETGMGMAALAGPAAGAIGRIAQNTGIGAAMGGLTKPEGDQTRTGNALKGGALGGAVSTGLEGVGAAGSKLADFLQQKAMGMKKYIPGVGSEAIDQGIRGTRDGMAQKTEDALSRLGNQASDQVQAIPGQVSSSAAAEPVSNYAASQKVGDILPGHSVSDYANATDRAADISGRGDVDPMDAWKLAQKAGSAGFRNQKALQSEGAYLAQLEQQGYSNALKDAYTRANPGSTDLPDTFSSMAKLYKAGNALNQPETIRQGLPITNMFGAAMGGAAAGGPGAVAGYLAAKAAKSPLVQSYGAKGLSMFGNGAETLADPAVLQSLFGAQKGSQ